MLGAIAAAFSRARRDRRVAFVPYVMAGDPDLATTEAVLRALSAAGADVIEVGVPYSDPLADGPTIAAAGQRALAGGTRLRDVLALIERCATRCAPLLLFTYFNPVDRYGVERLARDAAHAGAAGVIVPDCPLEESHELRAGCAAAALDMPLLVAPSTTPERAREIVEASTGFVYVVSRLGVTGAGRIPKVEPLLAQLRMLREFTDQPLAVGFGLSRPDDIAAIACVADGVVVGSALIDACAGSRGEDAACRAAAFFEVISKAPALY